MKTKLYVAIAAIVALGMPVIAGAAIFGSLGNFDVVNDTGGTGHGFEIELEDLHSSDISDTFGGAGRGFPSTVERYGAPSITEYTNGAIFGVRVTYQATFNSILGAWNVGTPSGVFNRPGDSCWTGGGIGYGPSTPCDHFGVGTVRNPSKTTYSWLVEATPGSPTLAKVVANIPAPVWSVIPAPIVVGQPIAPPVIVARIVAPPPRPELPEPQFGTPLWVKVYTTEVENKVELEDLVANNGIVLQARGKTEIEWQLLQTDPRNPAAGVLENGGAAAVGRKAEAVIRRYEFFKYTGPLDPVDNQVKPLLGDSKPAPGELGDFIGAQNAALNFAVAAVPEPESYAMLLAGLAMIGGIAARRSKRGRIAG